MEKYHIVLEKISVYQTEIEVEADSEDDAENIAIDSDKKHWELFDENIEVVELSCS